MLSIDDAITAGADDLAKNYSCKQILQIANHLNLSTDTFADEITIAISKKLLNSQVAEMRGEAKHHEPIIGEYFEGLESAPETQHLPPEISENIAEKAEYAKAEDLLDKLIASGKSYFSVAEHNSYSDIIKDSRVSFKQFHDLIIKYDLIDAFYKWLEANDELNSLGILIAGGYSDLVKAIVLKYKPFIEKNTLMQRAAKYSNVDFIKFLKNQGYPIDENINLYAVSNIDPQVLDYFLDLGYTGTNAVIDIAAIDNNMNKVKKLLAKGFKVSTSGMERTEANGHLDMLRFLYGQGFRGGVEEKNYDRQKMLEHLVAKGHLKMFKMMLKDHHLRIPQDSAEIAAENGHLKFLKYLISKGQEPPSGEFDDPEITKYLASLKKKGFFKKFLLFSKSS